MPLTDVLIGRITNSVTKSFNTDFFLQKQTLGIRNSSNHTVFENNQKTSHT